MQRHLLIMTGLAAAIGASENLGASLCSVAPGDDNPSPDQLAAAQLASQGASAVAATDPATQTDQQPPANTAAPASSTPQDATQPAVAETAPPAATQTAEEIVAAKDAQLFTDFSALRDKARAFVGSGDIAFAEASRGELVMIDMMERLWSLRMGGTVAAAPVDTAAFVSRDQLAGVVAQFSLVTGAIKSQLDTMGNTTTSASQLATYASSDALLELATAVGSLKKRFDDFTNAMTFGVKG